MHVISKKALAKFWLTHKESEKPLRSWYSICRKSKFKNFAQLKRAFNSVDRADVFTVFDIGGNKWRLVTVVHYEAAKIYIRHVFTHEEYDRFFRKKE